jgi:hypothetical protein
VWRRYSPCDTDRAGATRAPQTWPTAPVPQCGNKPRLYRISVRSCILQPTLRSCVYRVQSIHTTSEYRMLWPLCRAAVPRQPRLPASQRSAVCPAPACDTLHRVIRPTGQRTPVCTRPRLETAGGRRPLGRVRHVLVPACFQPLSPQRYHGRKGCKCAVGVCHVGASTRSMPSSSAISSAERCQSAALALAVICSGVVAPAITPLTGGCARSQAKASSTSGRARAAAKASSWGV